MASRMHTTLIHVRVEYARDGECWALSSKDLPGFFLAGGDLDKLLDDAPNAIKLLYRLNFDMEVDVAPVEDDGREAASRRSPFRLLPRSFVAMRAA